MAKNPLDKLLGAGINRSEEVSQEIKKINSIKSSSNDVLREDKKEKAEKKDEKKDNNKCEELVFTKAEKKEAPVKNVNTNKAVFDLSSKDVIYPSRMKKNSNGERRNAHTVSASFTEEEYLHLQECCEKYHTTPSYLIRTLVNNAI